MLGCDNARIVHPIGSEMLYLVIGYNLSTQNDTTTLFYDENGNSRAFPFIEEHCVASGRSVAELLAGAKRYKKLCGKKSWFDLKTKDKLRLARSWQERCIE